ncbi:MAG: WbqC family protein [Tunicatimonas sp.]
MRDTLLIEPHYFPSVAYLSLLSKYPKVVLEVHEHYPKQTYRNRCYVQGPNQLQLLTVPVRKGKGKVPTHAVTINHDEPWAAHHWRTLQSAYGNAPFFDFFAPDIHDIFKRKNYYLVDLSVAILTKCLEILQLEVESLTLSQKYHSVVPAGFFDARSILAPGLPPVMPPYFRPVAYQQLFGNNFVPNLSVIDLLFCAGSRANSVIRQSIEEQG